MSNYMTKAAAHARLLKLASAARVIRRQRALQKYAQAVQMQKAALDIDLSGHKVGVGAGIGALGGGLLGAGLGYGFGAKDKKLMSTLLGAGIGTAGGAGLGALGGYMLSDGKSGGTGSNLSPFDKAQEQWAASNYEDLQPGMSLRDDNLVIRNGQVVGYYMGDKKFVPAYTNLQGGMSLKPDGTVLWNNKPWGKKENIGDQVIIRRFSPNET